MQITDRGHVKLGDFGLASPFYKDMISTTSTSTPESQSAVHPVTTAFSNASMGSQPSINIPNPSPNLSSTPNSNSQRMAMRQKSKVRGISLSDTLWLEGTVGDYIDLIHSSFIYYVIHSFIHNFCMHKTPFLQYVQISTAWIAASRESQFKIGMRLHLAASRSPFACNAPLRKTNLILEYECFLVLFWCVRIIVVPLARSAIFSMRVRRWCLGMDTTTLWTGGLWEFCYSI